MTATAHVMILEDEPKIGTGVKRGLEKSGFTADWYGDSEKGLSRLLSSEKRYDLILMDLMMPRIDGWTITRTVRDAGVMTPILIVTARGETEFKTELLATGADDYLVKPFSFNELIARAHALLRRPSVVLPSRLSVGTIEMDTARRIVWQDEKEVSLTPRELALVELFMRHPGETLTRLKLLEHAFPRESGTTNVLDVHMKNLRKKLGEETFETVRGVGYKLNI